MSFPGTDAELPFSAPPEPQVVQGTVGWSDEDLWYEKGTADNDGYTLVRVQLFTGRTKTDAVTPGTAQGSKLLCHISGGLFRIPKKGTRCVVAIPAGQYHLPGAGVIIATIEKNPLIQYDDDRTQMNFGDDTHLVIRAKSIVLSDPANRFMMVGTSRAGGAPGLLFQDETGSGGCIQSGAVGWFSSQGGTAKSIIQIKPGGLECFHGSACMQLTNDNFVAIGNSAYVTGGAVYLGTLPTILTPAIYGLSGVAGNASTSVFISV